MLARIATVAILAATLAACGDAGPTATPDPAAAVAATAEAAAEATEEAGGVTLANYERLETGMSYEEVAAILGDPGEELSRSEMMGITTVAYMWTGKGSIGANMNAMFQNGEMISKAQMGLK